MHINYSMFFFSELYTVQCEKSKSFRRIINKNIGAHEIRRDFILKWSSIKNLSDFENCHPFSSAIADHFHAEHALMPSISEYRFQFREMEKFYSTLKRNKLRTNHTVIFSPFSVSSKKKLTSEQNLNLRLFNQPTRVIPRHKAPLSLQ